MARFTIYSKDGETKRYEGEPQYSGSYMGVDFVEFRTVSSPTPIDWQIGDYVDYYRTGKRYKLYSLPLPKKVAKRGEYGASFEYSNVQFHGATKELEIAPFRDLVTKDNQIHFSTRQDFSTYEDVYGIARRIQECMNDLYPNKWRIEVFDTDDPNLLDLFGETKEYSVGGGSCLDALSQIYETWKNVGWIHTYDSARDIDVITIGRANVRDAENTSDAFAYGIGKGLTAIKKASANKDEFATRLYIYGSERNIQTRYYNGLNILNKDSVDIRNLMLPTEKWGKTNGLPDASKAFLQADASIIEKYGIIPRTVYFDGNGNEEIYPSIAGLTMEKVRQAMIDAGQGDSEYLPTAHIHRIDKIVESYSSSYDDGTKEQTEKNMTFRLGLYQMGFNIAEQGKLTSEGFATISMKSGPCAGREFKVRRFSGVTYEKADGSKYYVYEIEKVWDESIGMGFPNNTYPINDGDEFVLLDIPMPDFYIAIAEDRLLEAGEKMLSDYTRVSAFYEPSVDAIKIKAGGKLLQAGMFMEVHDEDIIDTADNKDYVLIDTLTIDEKSNLPVYRVTLREQKRSARTYSALEDMIEDAKEINKQEINRARQYTDRRFRSAQETIEMLKSAFSNFSDGISPVTIRTMTMLIGDEGLQFKFTSGTNSLTEVACPFSYDENTKQMKSVTAYLKHMTLGIKTITAGTLSASEYKTWRVPAWSSAILDEASKSYYVYVKSSKSNSTSECLLSETPIGMEDVNGYYHFLVGILNSEYDGKRDFITLYGFTEVLPGQITTDVIRSGNNKLIIDLANAMIEAKSGATIKGAVTIGSGSSGLSNLSEWSGVQSQISSASSAASSAQKSANQALAANITLDAKITDVSNEVAESVAEINAKLDGVVESYFESYSPSSENEPAVTWIAEGKEEDHIGDTFTNTSISGDDAGKSWRWLKQADGSYAWQLIADSDAVKALLEASKALTAANRKSKTFVVQPSDYNEGDLWLLQSDSDHSAGKKGDLLTAKQDSISYSASHWEKAVRYTDDSLAEDAIDKARVAKEAADQASLATAKLNDDGVFTKIEKRELRRTIAEITECKGASVIPYNASIVRETVSGNPWYLVNDKSRAEWTDENKKEYSVSQAAWDGFYSSNMHTKSSNTITQLSISLLSDCTLKLQYGSDSETSYDYLSVGKLNESVTSSVIDTTKGAQGISNVKTREFVLNIKDKSEYSLQIQYLKDSSRDYDTDSGYYRLLNTSYMKSGVEYIVELNGSFHRYYLTLNRNGYYTEANELKTRLDAVMSILNNAGLWKDEDSNIGETFRNDLNTALTNYYAYAAQVGFDISMNRLNDAQYLSDAMKNGKTIIDNGLVMTSLVAVGDTTTDSSDVEAFLNGSTFANDGAHGKLILAGGIPESIKENDKVITDLEKRSKEAKTRIYEDGNIYSKALHLEEGATIGTAMRVSEDGIEIDSPNEGKVSITESGGFVSIANGMSVSASGSGCGNLLFRARTKNAYGLCPSKPVPAEISGDDDFYALVSYSGMFGGLRPAVRVYHGYTTESTNIDELDHTIIVEANCTLRLPESPYMGHRVEILKKYNVSVNIDSNGTQVYSTSQYNGNNGLGTKVTQIGASSFVRATFVYTGSYWFRMVETYD